MFYRHTEEHPEFGKAVEKLRNEIGDIALIRNSNNDVIVIPFSLMVSYNVVLEADLRNSDMAVFLSMNKGLVGIPQKNQLSDDLSQGHDAVGNIEGVRIIQRGKEPCGFTSKSGMFIEVAGPDHSTATTMLGNVMAILISQTIEVGNLTPLVFDTGLGEWVPESDETVKEIDDSDVRQGEVELIFDPKLGEFVPKAESKGTAPI